MTNIRTSFHCRVSIVFQYVAKTMRHSHVTYNIKNGPYICYVFNAEAESKISLLPCSLVIPFFVCRYILYNSNLNNLLNLSVVKENLKHFEISYPRNNVILF